MHTRTIVRGNRLQSMDLLHFAGHIIYPSKIPLSCLHVLAYVYSDMERNQCFIVLFILFPKFIHSLPIKDVMEVFSNGVRPAISFMHFMSQAGRKWVPYIKKSQLISRFSWLQRSVCVLSHSTGQSKC